jgi:hypothetical protein
VATALKHKTFFFIRDETYADAFDPEMRFHFVEEDEVVMEQLQRLKETIRLLPSSLPATDYRAPRKVVLYGRLLCVITEYMSYTMQPDKNNRLPRPL